MFSFSYYMHISTPNLGMPRDHRPIPASGSRRPPFICFLSAGQIPTGHANRPLYLAARSRAHKWLSLPPPSTGDARCNEIITTMHHLISIGHISSAVSKRNEDKSTVGFYQAFCIMR